MNNRKLTILKPRPGSEFGWMRTDPFSLFEYLYIFMLIRGLEDVIFMLQMALATEAEACRQRKEKHRPDWLRNATFCEDADRRIGQLLDDLLRDYPGEDPGWLQRRKPEPGKSYPLPEGGVYVPGKDD